ncbi:hypothetical protein E0G74_01240 [Salmonella enterica]|nr:hypothetical protein [Salmonella enterica]
MNKQAANVMKRGEHWEFDTSGKPAAVLEQDIPYVVMPEWMIGEGDYHTLPNLTGIQRGRLVAYGFYRPARKWACRCQCGRHVLRRTSAIANDKNSADCCLECRELLFIKREDYFRRTGKRITYEELV